MPILIPRASVFHIKKEYPNTLEANLTGGIFSIMVYDSTSNLCQ